jgi:hypothetical protein
MVHQKAAIAYDFLSHYDIPCLLEILQAESNIVDHEETAFNQHKWMLRGFIRLNSN